MVSIHAPVKVRLEYDPKTQTLSGVSIHAPVKVRPSGYIVIIICISFNSRTREGATQLALQNTFILSEFQFTHP